jgi:hypothetical protein
MIHPALNEFVRGLKQRSTAEPPKSLGLLL